MVSLCSSFTCLTGLVLVLGSFRAYGFNMNTNNNAVAYWGQDAYGSAAGSHPSLWQQPIDYYCQDDSLDVIPIAFVNVFFSTGGLPELNLANSCSGPAFDGTDLLNCQFLAQNIRNCQNAGKIVTISLGGDTGQNDFDSDDEAQEFAETIWNLFLGGSSDTRPFGDAVLDGVDLDIEGGSTDHYVAFVTQLRSYMDCASKQYYITGAPQCPFPDAYLGSVINAVGFDALYVQFYNNYCGVSNYNSPDDWDFGTWDNWAKTTSPNPDIKIYLGVAASSTAANNGYVDIGTLVPIIQATQSQYSSFGGVMMWDESEAYNNNRFDAAVKSALGGRSSSPPSGSYYQIHPNGDTSKCLDVESANYANGTPVDIYDCNGTGAQNWVISSGTTAVQVAGQNFCLDAGDSPADGTRMKIWECYSGLAAQTWYYTDDDRIALQNQGFCLDLTNGDSHDGTVMQIWKCTDHNTNQVWTLS
ncbi:hypothetical protein NM688_g6411 [Phlebia brevispora]|uniref:Uncharacterized protein n=1 Tax=Phlebia brevispora TaxID=194682 RepID=A0ACC1SGF3_9APHY|nr:hypothetical protein NM688_g6411 [Phlebia brevispora]